MRINLPARRRAFALVSMADIAFLLLIFLVLTVTAGDEGTVRLPSFLYTQKSEFDRNISITLTADGGVSIDGVPVAAGLDPRSIEVRIDRRLAEVSGEPPVVRLSADRNLPYDRVDSLLALLRAKGLTRVVLMTEPDTTPAREGRGRP